MSDSPLLNKMDALLKKHRGDSDADNNGDAIPATQATDSPTSSEAPPSAWLPVLTHLIERGTPPVVAAPAPESAVIAPPVPPSQAEVAPAVTIKDVAINDTLAEQLMSELAPRLSEVMEKQVSAELRKSLDHTVSTLLSQLDVSVREIVREAVAEKLKPPRDPTN